MGRFDDLLNVGSTGTTRRSGRFDDILDVDQPFQNYGGLQSAPPKPQAPRLGGFQPSPQPSPSRLLEDQVARQTAEQEGVFEMTPSERRRAINGLRRKYVKYGELFPFLDELEADEGLDYDRLEKEFLYAVSQFEAQKKQEQEQVKFAERANKDEAKRYEKFIKTQQAQEEKATQNAIRLQERTTQQMVKREDDAAKAALKAQTDIKKEEIKAGAKEQPEKKEDLKALEAAFGKDFVDSYEALNKENPLAAQAALLARQAKEAGDQASYERFSGLSKDFLRLQRMGKAGEAQMAEANRALQKTADALGYGRAAISGLTLGLGGRAVDKLVQKVSGEEDFEIGEYQTGVGKGLATAVEVGTGFGAAGRAIAGATKILPAAKTTAGAVAQRAGVQAAVGGVQSTANSLNAVARGEMTADEAKANIAAGILSSGLAAPVAAAVPGKLKNAVAQVATDLMVDLASDAAFTDYLQDQGFVDWFLTRELPNLVVSAAGAGIDLKGAYQQNQEIRKLVRDGLTRTINLDKGGGIPRGEEAPTIQRPTPEVTRPAPEATRPAAGITRPAPEVTRPAPEITRPAPEVVRPTAQGTMRPTAPEAVRPTEPKAPATRQEEYIARRKQEEAEATRIAKETKFKVGDIVELPGIYTKADQFFVIRRLNPDGTADLYTPGTGREMPNVTIRVPRFGGSAGEKPKNWRIVSESELPKWVTENKTVQSVKASATEPTPPPKAEEIIPPAGEAPRLRILGPPIGEPIEVGGRRYIQRRRGDETAWFGEDSGVEVKSAKTLKEINDAIQIRETETIPVGEGAGDRPTVDEGVRVEAPDQVKAQEEVVPPTETKTEAVTGKPTKTRLDQILDGVNDRSEVRVSLDRPMSRDEIRRVESVANARGIDAFYDGTGFLFRKKLTPEVPITGKPAEAPVQALEPAPRETLPPAGEEAPSYIKAREPLLTRATELGISTKGTNEEIQARIAKREKVMSFIGDVEAGAKQRLSEIQKTTTLGANKPLGMAVEYTIIGASKMARGTIKFADWSREMVSEFGDAIKPYLRQIYQRAITINKRDFDTPEDFTAFSTKMAEGLKMKTKDVEAATPIPPPPGMVERQTITRAAEGTTLTREAEALRESGEAFREVTPLKALAEKAVKDTEENSAATWNSIKSEIDPKTKVSRAVGYINAQVEKGVDVTTELDELAKAGTDAGTILRAMREIKMGTPAGRARIASDGFVAFAKTKKQQVSPEELSEIRKRFEAAEKATDEAERMKLYKEAVEYSVSKLKLRPKDWIDAYRYTNTLSSPRTHERNIVGNVFNVALNRPLALVGRGDLKGALTYTGNAAKNIGEAAERFKNVFKGENIPIRSTDDMTSVAAQDDFGKEYNKKIPKVFQVIPKFLEAQDQFFSQLIRGGETQRLISQGMDPKIAAEKADQLAENYLYRDRLGETERDKSANIFSRAVDGIGIAAQGLKRQENMLGKLADHMIMFVRTPVKIAERGFEFSPLGYVTPGTRKEGGKIWQRDWGLTDEGIAQGKYGKSFSKLNDEQKADVVFWKKERIGRANAGTAITALGGLMAMEGNTTWKEPSDPEEKAAFYESGRKPYSVKIGDKWVPYITFGPAALAFAIPAAVRDWSAENPNRVNNSTAENIAQMATGLANFFMTQTPVDGMAKMFQTITGQMGFDQTKLMETLGFTASQYIPLSSLQRYINQWMDGEFKNTSGFWDEIKQNVVGQSKDLIPYTTMDGLPAKRTAWDLLPPFSIGVDQPADNLQKRRKELERKNLAAKKADTLVKDYKKGLITVEEIINFYNSLDEDDKQGIRRRLRLADENIAKAFDAMKSPASGSFGKGFDTGFGGSSLGRGL